MKTAVEMGRISAGGTLSIPYAMLKELDLGKGADVVLVQGRESIMIKPVRRPDRKLALSKLFSWGNETRRKYRLKPEDIDKAIREVRRAHRT